MNAPVLHRRRIERYAQLLDEANGARRHHSRSPIDDELANMLTVSQDLAAATPLVKPSEEFRRDTRLMLLATAERDGIGRTANADAPEVFVSRPAVGRASVGTVHESAARRLLPKQRGSKARLTTNRARTRGAILIGLAVGTLALSGISAASGSAMPGDALYGMKRQAESAQIALARTPVSKGDLYLDFARTRLAEAQQIGPKSKYLTGTLTTMDQQTTDGVKSLLADALDHKNANALTTVDQFVTAQDTQLTTWERTYLRVGSAASNRAIKSEGLLNRIHLRSTEIRTALNCASTVKTVTTDALGREPSCQVSASAPLTGALVAPTHHSNSNSGSTSQSGTKPAEHSRAATVTTTKSTPVATSSSTAPAAPAPVPSYNGGVLGSVQQLLGGL